MGDPIELIQILTKGNEAELPNTYTDGKLRFTVDTRRLFLDTEDDRIEFSDFVKGEDEATILASTAPLPKLYLASDTKKLYYHNGTSWVSVTADHPSISTSATTASITPAFGSTFSAVTGMVIDSDGHVTAFETDTVTVPNATASTASSGLMPALDSDTTKYLKSDGTWSVPDNTTYAAVSTVTDGLAPQITNENGYLKGDGTWSVPDNTTYSNVSTASAGLAPVITNENGYLKGDGTWSVPDNTTYAEATSATAGLIILDGDATKYLKGDGTWGTVSGNDENVKNQVNSSTQALPIMLVNGTTASSEDITSTSYRNAGVYVIPSSKTIKSDYIDASPAPEVDFDFGLLNSTTPGDESYGD